MIYPTLTLPKELGHVTVSPGEGAKKLHDITDEGRAFLDGNRPAPQILRAMENLELALRMRLSRGPLGSEQIAAIAAALDAAATAVESA